MMMKTTPFHARLNELNQTGLYGHWSGYLSALRYDIVRQARVLRGPQQRGLLRHLAAVQVPDPGPGRRAVPRRRDDPRHPHAAARARRMYTVWCDDAGYVLEDGVLFRHADNDWLLTAAEPNLGYLESLVGRLQVAIEDVSADYGMLAVQGPRSREILAQLAPEVERPGVLRPDPRQDRRRAGHDLAHRLHRRPRLRGHRRGRRRARRARQDHPGRRRARASGRSARTRC